MDKRRQVRVAKNLLGKVTTLTSSFFAYVQDLAKTGIGISCNRKLPIGEAVEVALNMPERPTMTLKGRIAWVRALPSIAKNKFQYGIHLDDPPPVFVQTVEALVKRDFERRKHPRFLDVLLIESKDVLDLMDCSTTDVSAGGLYVGTNQPLEMGRQYTLKLSMDPPPEPLYCLVEVVAVYDTSGEEFSHPYGAGVRFISFAGDGEQRFGEYLRRLEDLYRYHWPPKAENPDEADVEIA
jgi:Tfp pilus assembly protein PilZ